MARAMEAADQSRYSSGLYAWLVEREELAHRRPGRTLPWTPEQPSYTGLPDRLITLRAGCAINLPVGDLPKHARVGLDEHWWNRVVVAPDGTITPTNDDALLWAAENGL
jgi:hypothetical protein